MINQSAKVAPLSRIDIRKITNAIKQQFHIPFDKPFPVVKFVEYALTELGLDYEILPDKDMSGVYAETVPEQGLLRISETTYDGACDGVPRDRFTIAHEIGHLLLHTPNRVIFTRSDNEIKPYENPEWQANTFAGELLVSMDFIQGLPVDSIAKKYEVSLDVASIQKGMSPQQTPV